MRTGGPRLKFEIDIDLVQDDLAPEVQADILLQLAERLAELGGDSSKKASLTLLVAAAVLVIRDAPSGAGVALDLKELTVEAMKIARTITKPQPRAGT